MVSSTSYFHQGRRFSLSFFCSLVLFPSLLSQRLISSLFLPLDGATFHPSLRSSFRCKVHMRTRLGKGDLLLFVYDHLVALKIFASGCDLRQREIKIWIISRGKNWITRYSLHIYFLTVKLNIYHFSHFVHHIYFHFKYRVSAIDINVNYADCVINWRFLCFFNKVGMTRRLTFHLILCIYLSRSNRK